MSSPNQPKSLGDALRDKMAQRGIEAVVGLAVHLDIGKTTAHSLLSGHYTMSDSMASRLADFLETTPEEVWAMSPEQEAPKGGRRLTLRRRRGQSEACFNYEQQTIQYGLALFGALLPGDSDSTDDDPLQRSLDELELARAAYEAEILQQASQGIPPSLITYWQRLSPRKKTDVLGYIESLASASESGDTLPAIKRTRTRISSRLEPED